MSVHQTSDIHVYVKSYRCMYAYVYIEHPCALSCFSCLAHAHSHTCNTHVYENTCVCELYQVTHCQPTEQDSVQ